MSTSQTFDVIVVGGGPGGAVAAKGCAEAGLATLLLEKKKLPRSKVCTGMVMGDWAHDIIRQEFGEIPVNVLTHPPYLASHKLYVPGTQPLTLQWHTPLTWRKDLDLWMVRRAEQSGVAVREGSPCVGVIRDQSGYRVVTHRDANTEEFVGRFVIGAEGAISVVRKSIFPELKVRYSTPLRECYQGSLDLEKDSIHWFFPKKRPRPRFNVNHKNDVFLIEGSGIKELRQEIRETLAPYGFDPNCKPQWNDACAISLLHEQLLAGKFVPAEQNALLIGDAAGFIFPITFEGIGSALKSGLVAAEAIASSAKTGKHASTVYLKEIAPVVETIRHLCKVQDELKAFSDAGVDAMATALLDAYRETLTVQRR